MPGSRNVLLEISESIKYLSKRIRKLENLVNSGRSAVACRVYNDATIVHNNTGNWMALTFNNEYWDTAGMHSTTTNPSRITFPVDGWYLVGGHAAFDANSTGIRRLTIQLGGATYLAVAGDNAPSASVSAFLSISTLYYFAATNYVEMTAYQNSGGNLNIIADGNYTLEFWAINFGN